MNVQIVQEAEDELNASVGYYEEIERGLGVRLKEEARAVIRWITENPEVPRLRPNGYRRVNLKIFQHYVAYILWGESIWVIAIVHGRRRPEFWLERKKLIE